MFLIFFRGARAKPGRATMRRGIRRRPSAQRAGGHVPAALPTGRADSKPHARGGGGHQGATPGAAQAAGGTDDAMARGVALVELQGLGCRV